MANIWDSVLISTLLARTMRSESGYFVCSMIWTSSTVDYSIRRREM
jgi:hypothetical protein